MNIKKNNYHRRENEKPVDRQPLRLRHDASDGRSGDLGRTGKSE